MKLNYDKAKASGYPVLIRDLPFCCWKYEKRNRKHTKVPFDPKTGRRARADDLSTFGTMEEAETALKGGRYSGIGVSISGGIGCIDLDGCITDDGTLSPEAEKTLALLPNAHAEKSPSGTGLHLFITVPDRFVFDKDTYYVNNRKRGSEIYLPGVTSRFVTLTGNLYRDGSLLTTADELSSFLETFMLRETMKKVAVTIPEGGSVLTDEQVLAKLAAESDKKFIDMYNGNWEDHAPSGDRFNWSHSDADMSLLMKLAFYCRGDMGQMDRLFRASGLMRDKWDRGLGESTYGVVSMTNAINKCSAFYESDHYRTTAAEDFGDIDNLDSRLDKFLSSEHTVGELYENENIILAAYAKISRPGDYEAIRASVRKQSMNMKRYEQEVKAKEEIISRRQAERLERQKIQEAERTYGAEIPDFIYFSRLRESFAVDATKLALYVSENLHYILVQDSVRDTRTKYIYENGVYTVCSDERFKGYIKQFVEDFDPALVRMKDIEEAFRNLSAGLTAVSFDELNADESVVNFKNGLLRLSDMKLLPHTPEIYSTIQLDCEWAGEDSATPVFDKYLDHLTGSDKETQTLLLQFIGAVLSNVRGSRYKKALFLTGAGDTGKSQLKILTERLLGRDNFAAVDISELETQFGASMIYGKRLAGTADMTFMTIRELKMFKTVTGGDNIKMEFKGKTGFSYIYNGLLWFCMNKPPKFGGDNGAWVYDRIILVHCPNVVAPQDQDHELIDKMYEERKGIVYKALVALMETIKNGYRFSESESILAARETYRINNDSVIKFFKTCMEERPVPGSISSRDFETVSLIYQTYMKWCRYNNNGYAKTFDEFKEAYAEYVGLPLDKAIGRRGKGYFLLYHKLTEEGISNMVPPEAGVLDSFGIRYGDAG